MTWHSSPQAGSRTGRFVPAVEALEDRRLPTVNFIVSLNPVLGNTLIILGPANRHQVQNENIVITDDGTAGVNNVRAFARQPFYPNVPIRNVLILTGRGDDSVSYNLAGDLTTTRTVVGDLGGGSNRFSAFLRRNLLAGANLTISINGGGRDDRLQASLIGSIRAGAHLALTLEGGRGNNIINVLSATFVNIDAGATVAVNLFGNGFADHIFSDYEGVLNGTYTVNEYGGGGPNRMTALVDLAFASTGTVGPSALVGGPSNDLMIFEVHNPGGANTNNNFLVGEGGLDTVFRTTNVVATDVERDNIVP